MAGSTRRRLLASAAPLAAVAAIPSVALAAVPPPDPDARLVALGRLFRASYAVEPVGDGVGDDRWLAALEEIATTPAAGPAGVAVKARCLVHEARDGDTEFKGALIDGLLADLDRIEGPAPTLPMPAPVAAVADDGRRIDPHPAWAAEATRRKAIVEAQDDLDDDELDRLCAPAWAAEDLICDTPARTLAGVVEQLRIIVRLHPPEGDFLEDRALRNVVAAVERLAGSVAHV